MEEIDIQPFADLIYAFLVTYRAALISEQELDTAVKVIFRGVIPIWNEKTQAPYFKGVLNKKWYRNIVMTLKDEKYKELAQYDAEAARKIVDALNLLVRGELKRGLNKAVLVMKDTYLYDYIAAYFRPEVQMVWRQLKNRNHVEKFIPSSKFPYPSKYTNPESKKYSLFSDQQYIKYAKKIESGGKLPHWNDDLDSFIDIANYYDLYKERELLFDNETEEYLKFIHIGTGYDEKSVRKILEEIIKSDENTLNSLLDTFINSSNDISKSNFFEKTKKFDFEIPETIAVILYGDMYDLRKKTVIAMFEEKRIIDALFKYVDKKRYGKIDHASIAIIGENINYTFPKIAKMPADDFLYFFGDGFFITALTNNVNFNITDENLKEALSYYAGRNFSHLTDSKVIALIKYLQDNYKKLFTLNLSKDVLSVLLYLVGYNKPRSFQLDVLNKLVDLEGGDIKDVMSDYVGEIDIKKTPTFTDYTEWLPKLFVELYPDELKESMNVLAKVSDAFTAASSSKTLSDFIKNDVELFFKDVENKGYLITDMTDKEIVNKFEEYKKLHPDSYHKELKAIFDNGAYGVYEYLNDEDKKYVRNDLIVVGDISTYYMNQFEKETSVFSDFTLEEVKTIVSNYSEKVYLLADFLKRVYRNNRDMLAGIIDALNNIKQYDVVNIILPEIISVNVNEVVNDVFSDSQIESFADGNERELIVSALRANGIDLKYIHEQKYDELSELYKEGRATGNYFNFIEEMDKPVQVELPDVKAKEIFMSEEEKKDLTVSFIRSYYAGKHGDIYPVIERVFDVTFPDDLWQEFVEKYPESENVNPAFHGTGGISANMILRFGFQILNDGELVTGKSLGNGIYITDKIDKAALYATNQGYNRGAGNRGYIFHLNAWLGPRKYWDYDGPEDERSTYGFLSNEWACYRYQHQLKFVRVYQVKTVSYDEYKKIDPKFDWRKLNEGVPVMPTFKQYLNEVKNPKDNRQIVFIFSKNIPLPDGTFTNDVNAAVNSQWGEGVEVGMGMGNFEVRIKTSKPTKIHRVNDGASMSPKQLDKYLKLVNKGKRK